MRALFRRRDRSDVEPLIAVDERPVRVSALFEPPTRPTFTEAQVDDIVATWRIRAKRLGRDYGRASATIHALRAENALLREDLDVHRGCGLDALETKKWALAAEQRVADLEEELAARRPTDVVGGGGAVNLGAAPKAGATAPGDYLLADHIRHAVEQLARDLCAVDMPDTAWGVDDARFKDRYRALAWAAAAVGWKPPVVLAAPLRVATVARVLTDHDWIGESCRCGWGGCPCESDRCAIKKPEFHAEHQAEQLVMLGVLG